MITPPRSPTISSDPRPEDLPTPAEPGGTPRTLVWHSSGRRGGPHMGHTQIVPYPHCEFGTQQATVAECDMAVVEQVQSWCHPEL